MPSSDSQDTSAPTPWTILGQVEFPAQHSKSIRTRKLGDLLIPVSPGASLNHDRQHRERLPFERELYTKMPFSLAKGTLIVYIRVP